MKTTLTELCQSVHSFTYFQKMTASSILKAFISSQDFVRNAEPTFQLGLFFTKFCFKRVFQLIEIILAASKEAFQWNGSLQVRC